MNLSDMTAKEAIASWDAGNTIWSIEMGGLGPGYEQAIQVCAIEILRDAIAKEEKRDTALSIEEFKQLRYETVSRIDDSIGGATGAMVGAATNIAWRAYNDGWSGMLQKAREQGIEDDRFIQVSKRFPHA